MTREIRSRRAGIPREQAKLAPLYARIIGLQYLTPSGFLCFVFLEGAVALGILLALAELVSWWGVLVLPLTVAAMVKLNDVIAGAVTRPAVATPGARIPLRQRTGGTARPSAGFPSAEATVRHAAIRPSTMPAGAAPAVAVPGPDDVTALNTAAFTPPWAPRAEEPDATQRARQTASRRYE
jgi:hypothetical protein